MGRGPGPLEGLGMTPGFWRGKRVLLTGHTGFKGSWLSLWLSDLGAELSGYALEPPTQPNLFSLIGLEGSLRHQLGDVRDLEGLRRSVAAARPEVVIHMAAQPLVRLSYEQPLETFATNVTGTAHLLEALRGQAGLRAVVVVTSDKCYQSRPGASAYREEDPLGGHDPYSNSKACAELVASCYRDSFYRGDGVGLATVRAGNVLGGGDWAKDRLVPDILRAQAAGTVPQIRYPDSVRPWQHVLEPLSGYLELAERLWQDPAAFAEAWNFGPDASDEKPVRWIAERMAELAGRDKARAWEPQPGVHPHEAPALKLDSSKARRRLGWAPRWGLDPALQAIVDWDRAHRDQGDLRDVCLRQIHAHSMV